MAFRGSVATSQALQEMQARKDAVAHELGHMMGLDDEYNQLRNTTHMGNPGVDRDECNALSIMCSDTYGDPQSYHYYVLQRRRLCRDTPAQIPI